MKLDKMTNIEWGISGDKQILVPSFGTTGALFARHFDILNNLKRRIILLKQAYFEQAHKELSAEYIEDVIKVLDQGCDFLNFNDIMKEINDEKEKKYYEDITLEEEEEAAKQRQKDLEKAEMQTPNDSENDDEEGEDPEDKEMDEQDGEGEK